MATWMVHLRVADYFLDRVSEESKDEFIIGSVAPDCGYGKKDSFSGFTPPATVTHWTDSGYKTDIDTDKFYDTYLKNTEVWGKAAFYLGYFIHLLTDIKWSSQMYLPTRIKYHDEYEKNPEFLIEIKKDWNDLDYRFLTENPNMRTYNRFCKVCKDTRIRDFLPYYEPGQLDIQCKRIAEYYKHYKPSQDIMREYKYLTPKIQNEFVDEINRSVERFLTAADIL